MNHCSICNIEMSENTFSTTGETIDHITPISRNGNRRFSNLQSVCRSCNSKKGSRFSYEIKIYEKTDFIFLKNLISNEIKNNIFDKASIEESLCTAKNKYQALIDSIDDVLLKTQEQVK